MRAGESAGGNRRAAAVVFLDFVVFGAPAAWAAGLHRRRVVALGWIGRGWNVGALGFEGRIQV